MSYESKSRSPSLKARSLLNSEQNDERSVARKADSSNAAGFISIKNNN